MPFTGSGRLRFTAMAARGDLTIDIPDLPSPIGRRVFGQALVMQPNGEMGTTNLDSKVVG